MGRTFVGFGFGPIQAGLFLFEAFRSGNFSRLVAVEIDRALVDAVRGSGGRYALNIAHAHGIEAVEVTGLEIYDPRRERDRRRIIEAVREAQELATAVPSVEAYDAGGEAGIAALLAAGLDDEHPRLIYAAENHNRAAQLLRRAVLRRRSSPLPPTSAFLNTVIGKMSRSVSDPEEMARLGLRPLAPGLRRAYLVEAFNRILVSRAPLAGHRRLIPVFEEKDDLDPFQEAKLYGHNAVHALVAYLGYVAGYRYIAEAARDERIMAAARTAFLEESGAALCRKYAHLGDPLFSPAGYRAYAEDLLARMANPHLNDTVARVARQPERKLGYHDRIFGTMRLALEAGVEPTRMALAAAAGLLYLKQGGRPLPPGLLPTEVVSPGEVEAVLCGLWGEEARAGEQVPHLLALVRDGLSELAPFRPSR